MATYQVRDASPFSNFTMLPNMVDDMNLTPHAARLYWHLKRVTGEKGVCYQSTVTLAQACRMSAGMISKAKKELMETTPPLISVALTNNPHGGKDYHEITIMDVWAENQRRYSSSQYEQQVHNMNVTSSRDEFASSQYEPKNTPVKKNPIKNKESSPDIPPGLFALPNFVKVWSEWVKYRKEIGKPLKDTTTVKQFAFLLENRAEAVAILEQSMTQGWQGLFKLKKTGYTKMQPAQVGREPTEAELEATREAIRKAQAQTPIPDEEIF